MLPICRYGALAGFGLSLTKWTLIIKKSSDFAVNAAFNDVDFRGGGGGNHHHRQDKTSSPKKSVPQVW